LDVLLRMTVPPQAQFTGQSMETITRDTDRDFFMSPQEAIEYGLVDAIIAKPQVLPARDLAAVA
jgi:ATP-dependent Clp protease protease subunit